MGTKRKVEDEHAGSLHSFNVQPKTIILRACKLTCESLAITLNQSSLNESCHRRWKWAWSRGAAERLEQCEPIDGWLTREVPSTSQPKAQSASTPSSSQQGRGRFKAVLTKPAHMQAALRQEIFDLFESNMRAHYDQADGWDAEEKQSELFHVDSRFLCLLEHMCDDQHTDLESRTHHSSLVGFVMFRFDLEDCSRSDPLFRPFSRVTKRRKLPVLYCYELQVDSRHQSLGLGSALVQAMQTIGTQTGMVKCMLTVFKSNQEARSFYDRLGYKKDGICPTEEEGASYDILSRPCVSV